MQVNEPVFTGVGVALVTLFRHDESLDAPATAEHAARLASLGMRAVVVAGSTGEAPALSAEERLELLRAVRREVPHDIPVIAGTGAASARQAAELTKGAADAAADAVLVLSPPHVPDPRPYYERVAEAAGGLPVLAYHFPAVSPPGVAVGILPELPIAGLKDSSGDPTRLLETLDTWGGPLYAGSAAILALAGPLGCAGAILALANAEPELCVRAFAGDAEAQRALASPHLRARRSFPGGIKELTAARFGTPTTARLG